MTIVAGVAAGLSADEVAKTARLSRATIFRALNDPDLVAEVAVLRHAMLDATLGRLHVGAQAAAECLVELVKSSNNDAVKVSAARSILENVSRFKAELVLEARIAALERQLVEQADRPVAVPALREVQ